MKPREKKLAWVVGGLIGFFALFLIFRAIMVLPLRSIQREIGVVQGKLDKLRDQRRAYFAAEEKLKEVARHSFALDTDEASARSGEVLTRQITASGLRDGDFSRVPVGPRRLRGANEIGWSVQGEGPLPKVINLLYLLEASPYAHRLEGLFVASSDKPGQIKVRFRYLTLVLAPAPEVETRELPLDFALDTAERRRYDLIVRRDLFSPFVPPAPAPSPGSPPSTSPAAPATFRVVSLSEWQGQPEVHVRDLNKKETVTYRLGDELAGGVIVLVDYRPLPLPGHPGLMSHSRVILKVGEEYWAIERGQTLTEKYKLQPEQLPERLASITKS